MSNNIQYPISIFLKSSDSDAAAEYFPDFEIYNRKNINQKAENDEDAFEMVLLPKKELKNEKLVEFENKALTKSLNFKLILPNDMNFETCKEVIKDLFPYLQEKNFKFLSKGRKVSRYRTVDTITGKVFIVLDKEPISEKSIAFTNDIIKHSCKYDSSEDPSIEEAFKVVSEKYGLEKLPIIFISGKEILDSKKKLSELKSDEIEFYFNAIKLQKNPEPQRYEELLTEFNFVFDSFQGDALYMLEFPLKIEKTATPSKIIEAIRTKFNLNQKLKFVLRNESEDITQKVMNYQNNVIHISFTNIRFRYKYSNTSNSENVEIPCNYTFQGFLNFYQIDPNFVNKIEYNGHVVDQNQLIYEVIEGQNSLITIFKKSVTFLSAKGESYEFKFINDKTLRFYVEELAKQLNVTYYSILIKDECCLKKMADINFELPISFYIVPDNYDKFTKSLENAKSKPEYATLKEMEFDEEMSAVVLTIISELKNAVEFLLSQNNKDEQEKLKNLLQLLNKEFQSYRIFTNPEDYVGNIFKPEVIISAHKDIVKNYLKDAKF
ncbi:hypothetical protein TVAG_051050 [Trichomonas vaginalis G3]|uniref:Uncharacterized protein n=1 Tax=Trichomonas vaginalis (strain ATCC PRA-98 / G3) TaxID=412133 RepID=A2EER4_TRIV3|nr:hypothetical protein TVAGG3_0982000 [Trichomonas vaginalis G3]EAY08870.1 hypothetical protein TVAG_051050 [Trichomonas vaginalis G3]KAI5489365.1 hypothetical protein TVAGG3_0982000 [Trichomonas vaginalis G3]|eukprot:XP_001321093.1 hypothetical protein [Trichomonas vaginalis G3]